MALSLRAVLLLGLFQIAATQDCFFPNGSKDPNGRICDVEAVEAGGHSACCNANDACYSDGTCATTQGNVGYRASCTDKEWRYGGCAAGTCTPEQGGSK